MIGIEIKPTYKGKPLQTLNDLVQKRMTLLGNTYKDAVIATAIDALRSIRAVTENHAGKEIVVGDGDVTITRRGDIHPSFSGKEHKRCFRAGATPSRNAPRIDMTGSKCVCLVPPSDKIWMSAGVWNVTVSKKRLERWPRHPAKLTVVATSEQQVMNYITKRFSNIAKRQSGLAQCVLGALMGKLSTRPPANPKSGEHVNKIVGRYGLVNKTDANSTYSVHVESNLLYAKDAVKGGESGIQMALKKAANKIAGMLKHFACKNLDERITTPFPEVKR